MRKILLTILGLITAFPCFASFGRETLYATRQETEFDAGIYSGTKRTAKNVALDSVAGTNGAYKDTTTIPQGDFLTYWLQLEESTGNASDVTGKYIGNATSVQYSQIGKIQNCFGFDGSGSIQMNDTTLSNNLDTFTFSQWIYRTSNSALANCFLSAYVGGFTQTVFLFSILPSCEPYCFIGTGSSSSADWARAHTDTFALDTWYLVTITCDNVNVRWYVNTKYDTTSLAGLSIRTGSSVPIYYGKVGSIGDDASWRWHGYIDEPLFIKGKCLTPEEVAFMYNNPSRSSSASGYTAEGTYTTDVMDLGQVPATDKMFLTKQATPNTSSLDWKWSGSLDNSTWTDSAVTHNGGSIGKYRYYRFWGHLVLGATYDTPYFWFLEVDPSASLNTDKNGIGGNDLWKEMEFGR